VTVDHYNIQGLPSDLLSSDEVGGREIKVSLYDGEGNPLSSTLDHETDSITILNEISRKLSTLIEYQVLMHKVRLEEEQ